MRKAVIVKTKSGKKGYVFYDENKDLKKEKLKVRVIDDKFQETGENLLCSLKSVYAIGYKD